MTDTIRCPACRGAKKVPKLGGIIGECNTCTGKGTILAVDKPKPVIIEAVDVASDIINAVANAVPVTNVFSKPEFCEAFGKELDKAVKDKFTVVEPVALPEEAQVKIDGKKALYKRKTAASR